MNRKEKLLNLITTSISNLDEIDDMITSQSTELQLVDLELSDLYHLIENNELDETQSYNIVKRIHDLRVERRILNDEHELELVYNANKSKLSGDNTRQFIIAEVRKMNNRLESEYKNRVLDDEKIKILLGVEETKKRGRPKKEKLNESEE